MEEDFSPPKSKKEMLALLEKDKGNKIASLEAQLTELSSALPIRLEEREKLEANISELTETADGIREEIKDLERAKWKSQDQLASAERDLKKWRTEVQQCKESVKDLEQKIEERNAIAEEIKKLQPLQTDLEESIRIKTLELRSLEVKINPIKEREARIEDREKDAEDRYLEVAQMLHDSEEKYDHTANLQKKIEEDRLHIDLSGKSMGYYIRGVQKIFDAKGIPVNFIELLKEIK